jgi:hypothetical protein
MVALTKSQLLRQSNYFGKRSLKGSNRKMVNIKGMGLAPFGQGMQTLGSGYGYGMNVISGGSILSALKSIAVPLLKKGTTALLGVGKSALANKAAQIKDPKLRALAEAGLKTGTELVGQALKGNKDLSKYQDVLKRNIGENTGLLGDVARQEAPKLLGKLTKGKGMKGGRALPDTVAGVTDRKLKPSTVNSTTDNRQLTLLKDIIRSKPVTTRVNKRGSGLSTF